MYYISANHTQYALYTREAAAIPTAVVPTNTIPTEIHVDRHVIALYIHIH